MSENSGGPSLSLLGFPCTPEPDGYEGEDDDDEQWNDNSSSNGTLRDTLVGFGIRDVLEDSITTVGIGWAFGGGGDLTIDGGRSEELRVVLVDLENGTRWGSRIPNRFARLNDRKLELSRSAVPPFWIQIDLVLTEREIDSFPTLNETA